MKEEICKKTDKPIRKDVIINGVNLGKQMDFEQLNLCILCDETECMRINILRGKVMRRKGL